jgi:hypothetical protein
VNAGGVLIVLAGTWLIFQVIGGDALQRLKVIT